MSSLGVVVVDVTPQYRPQMTLIHNDQMVQAFPPDAPDQSFAISILPRCSLRGQDRPNAKWFHGVSEEFAECLATIADQELERLYVAECISQLLAGPFSSWVICHVEVDDPSSVVGEEHEHMEQLEGDGGGDNEEVDSSAGATG